jgi:hypothetical protein
MIGADGCFNRFASIHIPIQRLDAIAEFAGRRELVSAERQVAFFRLGD